MLRTPSAGAGARPPRGFTVLELMLAVGLVGVLATVALPAYTSWRVKARGRQAAQEITMMATSIKMQAVDSGTYPADLAATGFATRLDPWGRSYVYYNVASNGRGGARKDRALNPINSDFDLYSVGPDGVTHVQVSQTAALDDVIRANNGGYVGPAASF